jgi:hypothetical protein
MRRMGLPRSLLLMAASLCACAPALDWRLVKPAQMELEALFPCRPAALARDVPLLKERLPMVVHACSASGSTFAIASMALGDVRDVSAAIDALRDAAARNLGAELGECRAFDVPNMTPNPHAGRCMLKGRRPDGSAVAEHLLVFAHGARVYQASVVGDAPDEAAATTFFNGLKVTS